MSKKLEFEITVNSSIQEASKLVKGMVSDSEKIKSNLTLDKDTGSIANQTKKIKERSDAIEKEKKSVSSLLSAKNELEKLERQEVQLKGKLSVAATEQNKKNVRLKVGLQDYNKQLKNSIQAEKAQEGSIKKLGLELNKNIKKYSSLSKAQRENTKEGKQLLRTIQAQDKEHKKLNETIGRSQGKVGGYSKAIGGSIKSMAGMYLGVTALIGGLKSIGRTFIQFEKENSRLASILGKTKDETNLLSEDSKRLGAITAFTATQVTSLQIELAKLGFTQGEIKGSTEGVLALSAATGTELARSAEIAGATIRAFGLDASEAGRVADVFAASTSKSALDMEKLGTAISTVAPVAANANVSLEKTVAQLGKLTDRGLDASTAGTGLRNVYLELSKRGISLNDALGKINAASDKNAAALELFGKRGATVGTILASTTEEVAKLEEELENAAGTAQEMADVQLDNLSGSVTKMKSAWEGLILSVEDGGGIISESLRGFIDQLTKGLQALNELNTSMEDLTKKTQEEGLDNFRESLKNLSKEELEAKTKLIELGIERAKIAGEEVKSIDKSTEGIGNNKAKLLLLLNPITAIGLGIATINKNSKKGLEDSGQVLDELKGRLSILKDQSEEAKKIEESKEKAAKEASLAAKKLIDDQIEADRKAKEKLFKNELKLLQERQKLQILNAQLAESSAQEIYEIRQRQFDETLLLYEQFGKGQQSISKQTQLNQLNDQKSFAEEFRQENERLLKSIDEQERKSYEEKQTLQKSAFDLSIKQAEAEGATSKDLAKEKKRFEIQQAIETLDFLRLNGEQRNATQIKLTKDLIAGLEIELGELDNIKKPRLQEILGMTDEEFSATKEAAANFVNQLGSFLGQIADQQLQTAEIQIQQSNDIIRDLENDLKTQEDNIRAGLAGNTQAIEKNIAKEKEARKKAQEDRKKAIKTQNALDTASQVSSIITAIANVIKGWSEVPLIGSILGIAAAGVMVGAFAKLKIDQSKNVKKLAKGDTGIFGGGSHSTGNDTYVPEIGAKVQSGERWDVWSREDTQKYSPLLDNIRSGNTDKIMNSLNPGSVNNIIIPDNTNKELRNQNKLLEKSVKIQRSIRDKKGITYHPNGYIKYDDNGNIHIVNV